MSPLSSEAQAGDTPDPKGQGQTLALKPLRAELPGTMCGLASGGRDFAGSRRRRKGQPACLPDRPP